MNKCHDCNDVVSEEQQKSKKFGVYLCHSCWEARTGWDIIKKAAADPNYSDADVGILAAMVAYDEEIK